jgi:hypothetical protein
MTKGAAAGKAMVSQTLNPSYGAEMLYNLRCGMPATFPLKGTDLIPGGKWLLPVQADSRIGLATAATLN